MISHGLLIGIALIALDDLFQIVMDSGLITGNNISSKHSASIQFSFLNPGHLNRFQNFLI